MLDHAQTGALAAIVAGPLAWSEASALTRLGHCTETIRTLEVLGLVERWELLDSWTLTPIGASLLDVELIEVGPVEEPRWAEAKSIDPRRPIRMPREPHTSQLVLPELVADELEQDPEPEGPGVLWDHWADAPVLLWGSTVPIDSRLGVKG